MKITLEYFLTKNEEKIARKNFEYAVKYSPGLFKSLDEYLRFTMLNGFNSELYEEYKRNEFIEKKVIT